MFIDPNAKHAIKIDKENTVFVRKKMTLQVKARFQRELFAFRVLSGEDTEVLFSELGQRLAYLKTNLLDWDGPSFKRANGKKIKCNNKAIEELDPDQKWIKVVCDEIDRLNTPKGMEEDGDPK